jgi:hypothetical protein|tara:strand:+ start:668 stop:961 length:294 start_codon:yes stop_codon:yes gene_type:complete
MSTLVSTTELNDGSGLSRLLFDDGSYIDTEVSDDREPTAEEIAVTARKWRDSELSSTDWIVPLSDHPQRAAYLNLRTALRDWPSTADFPATKPTLGS